MSWRRRRRARSECLPGIAAAFGIGLILACFVSAKFALFLAAIALVCLAANRGRR